MKYRWDKKYLYWGLTAFLVISASICFFMSIFRFDYVQNSWNLIVQILMPITYGLIIAYLLEPIMMFFERLSIRLINKKAKVKFSIKNLKFSRVFSIFITFSLSLLFLAGLVSMVLPEIISSLATILVEFPDYIKNANASILKLMEDNPDLAKMVEKILNNFSTSVQNIITNDILPRVNDIVKSLTTGILGILLFFKNLLIGIIVSIYVLYSKDLFSAQAKKCLYAFLAIKNANLVIKTVRRAHKIFGGFITGKLLDSLIIGVLCFIVMNLLGWPYAVLISVIIGITNIIPFFGPFIGAIPSSLLILLVEPMTCFYFVIFILILQQFDGNILGPKILGDSTGLSCFWVIFSILVFGGLFGFGGMVIGVPTFAVLYTIFQDICKKILTDKALPYKTSAYESLEEIDSDTGKITRYKKE